MRPGRQMMQVPAPLPPTVPGSPMSGTASCTAAVVADTIVPTVELGAMITDVAVAFAACSAMAKAADPGCSVASPYRATVIRTVTDVPVLEQPLRLRVRVPRYRCRAVEGAREVSAHTT